MNEKQEINKRSCPASAGLLSQDLEDVFLPVKRYTGARL